MLDRLAAGIMRKSRVSAGSETITPVVGREVEIVFQADPVVLAHRAMGGTERGKPFENRFKKGGGVTEMGAVQTYGPN